MESSQRQTPETDAAQINLGSACGEFSEWYVKPDFARKLERERDEAREELGELREKINSLEFRLSQEKHLNSDHEQDYLAVWKLIKRPDETVVQAAQRLKAENEAMREAIKGAQESLQWALSEINHVDISKPEYCDGIHAHADPNCPTCAKYQKAKSTLAKLQPFLKP